MPCYKDTVLHCFMIDFGQKHQVYGRQFVMGVASSWAVLWVIGGHTKQGGVTSGFYEAMEKQRDRRQGEGGHAAKRLGSFIVDS